MDVKEALVIVEKKFPNKKVAKCVEYDSLFEFQMVPSTYDLKKGTSDLLDCSFSVNKITKEAKVFSPFDISPDEYRRGKTIKI